MRSSVISGILPVVIPSIPKNSRQMTYVTKIRLIAHRFAREKRVQGMLKIIAPLRAQSISTAFGRKQDFRVVQIALCHQVKFASESFPRKLNFILKLSQNVICAKVVYSVNRVEPQNVDMKLFEPKK